MPLIVKICGLSTIETLDAALQAGVDMVGFVFFPPSPRHLELQRARELSPQVRGRAGKVALTVDADDATLSGIIEALRPDLLQLHGKETVARIREIKRLFGLPVMKAIGVETAADLAELLGYAAVADRLLFDARPPKDATRPGGLGVPFDWRLLEICPSKCHSCCREVWPQAIFTMRCASPAPAGSMSRQAWKARRGSRMPE